MSKRSADKAGKQSKEAQDRLAAVEEGRLALAQQQEERASTLFDRYMEQYAPREEALLSEAFDRQISPAQAEARATTDVRSSLETARQMGDRNLRRYGVNPNSGTYVGLDRMRELGGAKIEAGARTRAREGVRDKNFARQAAVVGLGRNLPVSAAGFAAQAGAGYAGSASLAAARAGRAEDLAYTAGSNYGQALGDAVGTIAGGIEDWWKNRNPPEEESTPRGGP
jgi:hypothetical protein